MADYYCGYYVASNGNVFLGALCNLTPPNVVNTQIVMQAWFHTPFSLNGQACRSDFDLHTTNTTTAMLSTTVYATVTNGMAIAEVTNAITFLQVTTLQLKGNMNVANDTAGNRSFCRFRFRWQ